MILAEINLSFSLLQTTPSIHRGSLKQNKDILKSVHLFRAVEMETIHEKCSFPRTLKKMVNPRIIKRLQNTTTFTVVSFFFVFLNTGEDPLSDLLESPGRKKPQQQLSNTAEVATTGHGGGSSKVGHSNKSKVMHDLFGLEESPLKTNILQKTKESTEDQSMASSNNSLR